MGPPPPDKEPRTGTTLKQADLRLAQLYEISKLFASFENVQQTFDTALGIVNETLPLRSAILIEEGEGRTEMIVWTSEGQDAEQLRAVKQHVVAAYAYLIGASSPDSVELSERAGRTTLPPQPVIEGDLARRFVVIPLVVARRPPFGALQLEVAGPLDKPDLMFVNAMVNQLSIALDRDHVRRRDVMRREDAEAGRGKAEVRGATAEKGRAIAEDLREKYEALSA